MHVELYPTVVTSQDLTRTAVVDHRQFAEQLLRISSIRLLHRNDRKEIRSHLQYMPQFNTCSLQLSDRMPGEKLREWLGDLMARLAFLDTKWHAEKLERGFRTKTEFDLAKLRRIERLSLSAAEVAKWLPRLAEANHRVRALLEKPAANWGESKTRIQEQVGALWDYSNTWNAPWCVIKEYPRYLQSIALRLEKLKSSGSAKDLATDGPAEAFWQDYKKKLTEIQPPQTTLSGAASVMSNAIGVESLLPTEKLAEYRWAIEELRVSIHSQHLGTRISVSPKRLEKMQATF